MEGTTLSHFRILEKIGKGGMGIVYKAEDVKLGRTVAIKLLPPHLVEDENRRARFVSEARTTAAVTHPNIATIYEIDEVDGTIFIAMEYLDGQTLRERIGGEALPLKDAIEQAVQIAEGLNAAHQANIVHRDLKPENIMIMKDGHLKILDFGLARLLEPEPDQPGDTLVTPASAALTDKQSILGTPTYMSPEQARGRELDFRSDIFSFGSTFYEMLTGQAPFQAATSADTISDLLNKDPVPVSGLNPNVPSSVQWVLDKCLEKDAGERYQDTRDLVVDLRHLVRDSVSIPRPSVEMRPVSTPAPTPASASAPDSVSGDPADPFYSSGAQVVRRSRVRPAALVAAVAVIALGFLTVQRLVDRGASSFPEAEENSLAIFAFENLAEPTDPQRYGQIFQDLLITSLSDLEPLRVFSGQRVFDIQKQLSRGRDVAFDREFATDVARHVGAQHMLTGSLGQLGDKWILTCQLMQVDDGTVVFSKRIDGEDLYAIADDLTRQLQDDMRIAAPTELSKRISLRDKTSSSMDAYKHYMDGQDLLNAGQYREAADALRRAVEIDPEFAQAHTKLAVAIWWPRDNPRGARDVLEDALARDLYTTEKDKLLAEAYLDQMHERFSDALPKFERLTEEYPEDKEVWYGLGESLFHFPGGGRREEATVAFEKAVALDPDFLVPYEHIFDTMWANLKFDEARERAEELVRRDPDNALWHRFKAEARAFTVPEEEIDAVLAEALDQQHTAADRRELYKGMAIRLGNRGFVTQTEEYLEKALQADPDHDDLSIVRALMSLLRPQAKWGELERRVRIQLEKDPTYTVAYEDLFRVYEAKRRYGDALVDAQRLTQQFPNDREWSRRWVRYAVLSDDADAIETAVSAAEEGIESTDDRRKLLGTLGWAYDYRGDHNRAIGYFKKQITVEPDREYHFIYYALGRQELARGRWDASRTWFEKSLAVSPKALESVEGLLTVSRESGDAAGTHAAIQRLLEELPPGPMRSLLEAANRLADGQIDEARALVDEYMARPDPEWMKSEAIIEIGWHFYMTGDIARAEEMFQRATTMEMARRDPRAHIGLGLCQLVQRRYDEAGRTFQQALSTGYAERERGPRLGLAAVKLIQGDAEAAERLVQAELDASPHVDSWRALGLLKLTQGRFEDALPVVERCVELDSTRASHELLAWALVAGDIDVARGMREAELALELPIPVSDVGSKLPIWPVAEHSLGLAYLKNKQPELAAEHLRRAVERLPDRPSLQSDLERAEAMLEGTP